MVILQSKKRKNIIYYERKIFKSKTIIQTVRKNYK